MQRPTDATRIAVVTLALTLLALPALAANHFVSIEGTTFVPSSITIRAGDTVFWTNTDVLLNHTVTSGNPCSPNGIFNSGILAPEGGQFSFTFSSVGLFNYYCLFHCLGGMTGDVTVLEAPTPVESPAPTATLGQNFPNPFNPKTTIEYSLPTRSRAVLAIYDSEGSLVVRMDQGLRDAGTHRVEWDGRDASGAAVGSGVYFYRLEGVAGVAPRKMVLLK
jgi:plastocyanin